MFTSIWAPALKWILPAIHNIYLNFNILAGRTMGSSAFSTSPWEPVERLACTEQFQSGSSHPSKRENLGIKCSTCAAWLPTEQNVLFQSVKWEKQNRVMHASVPEKMIISRWNKFGELDWSCIACIKAKVGNWWLEWQADSYMYHWNIDKYRMYCTSVASGLPLSPLPSLAGFAYLFCICLPCFYRVAGMECVHFILCSAWLLKSVRYCSCPCRKWAKEDISSFWTMPNMAMNWANCRTCMFETLWLTRSEWIHVISMSRVDFMFLFKESFFSFLRVQSHDRSEEQILSGPAVLSQQLRSSEVHTSPNCIEDCSEISRSWKHWNSAPYDPWIPWWAYSSEVNFCVMLWDWRSEQNIEGPWRAQRQTLSHLLDFGFGTRLSTEM